MSGIINALGDLLVIIDVDCKDPAAVSRAVSTYPSDLAPLYLLNLAFIAWHSVLPRSMSLAIYKDEIARPLYVVDKRQTFLNGRVANDDTHNRDVQTYRGIQRPNVARQSVCNCRCR
jgi:hypothetical protein